ncbi:MAG: hypothetical protein KatS3mg011_0360 [Acidimicrobiia bacterium]|nr:MAG: hypothetical protein KatS3mg011_0360 [Acidimicrobiia bacterium]
MITRLVGLEIPQPGCWEITATYRDATLTYVVRVESPVGG